LQRVLRKNFPAVGVARALCRRRFGQPTRYPARRQIRARRSDPRACDEAEVESMGFLDKAKQLAEQAQQKLDEAKQIADSEGR